MNSLVLSLGKFVVKIFEFIDFVVVYNIDVIYFIYIWIIEGLILNIVGNIKVYVFLFVGWYIVSVIVNNSLGSLIVEIDIIV